MQMILCCDNMGKKFARALVCNVMFFFVCVVHTKVHGRGEISFPLHHHEGSELLFLSKNVSIQR